MLLTEILCIGYVSVVKSQVPVWILSLTTKLQPYVDILTSEVSAALLYGLSKLYLCLHP